MKKNVNIKELPCPVCNTLNTVSRANLRLKCHNCGARLLSVRVKTKLKKNKIYK